MGCLRCGRECGLMMSLCVFVRSSVKSAFLGPVCRAEVGPRVYDVGDVINGLLIPVTSRGLPIAVEGQKGCCCRPGALTSLAY